jgi:hypothetical protein
MYDVALVPLIRLVVPLVGLVVLIGLFTNSSHELF